MKQTWKKLGELLLAAAMTMSLAACSQQENGAEDNSIVLGTSADYAPFEFHKMIDGKDVIMGSDIALAQKIAEDMGKELVIKDMDFNSLLIELDNGTVDFVIASMAPSEDRKKQVDFSEPYEYSKVGCLVRTEDVEKYPTVESLEGKAIAAQTGSNLEEIANEQMSGSTLVSLAKIPDMIMQLQTGKVEAVLMDADTALGYLAQSDELTMVDYGLHIDDDGLAVAVKKGNSELLEQINATVKETRDSGQMEKFKEEAVAQAPEEE
ncbi:MAG: transporter substrate-binding domain-containing protein [Clostridiaceae bacterium]|jgi:ABC-type amino acid transport substrate-binding protein|nr:transporter substrate-binding domain-containing protein [Clostridiaceae bacterium]